MSQLSRRHLLAVAASGVCATLAAPARADAFPSRPIRMIVPYGAGGGSDFVGRLLAQKLTETLGWNVVVDNKAGAAGLIGTDAAAKSAADGYTLLLADAAHATNAAVHVKTPFDPVKDFAPLSLVGSSPQLLVAHPSVPASSLRELLALPRERSRELSVGTPGQGTIPHLLCETLRVKTGLDLIHVPYKGGSSALSDAVGGQIPLVINSVPACMPHLEARRLKVLAIASPARHPRMPSVQTFAESVPGMVGQAWYGLMAPARTPPDILQPLNAAIDKVLALPEVKAKLASAFIDPMPGGPQAFAGYLNDEIARWQAVVKLTGVTASS